MSSRKLSHDGFADPCNHIQYLILFILTIRGLNKISIKHFSFHHIEKKF